MSTEQNRLLCVGVVSHRRQRAVRWRSHGDCTARPGLSIKRPGVVTKMVQIQIVGIKRATAAWTRLSAKEDRLMMLSVVNDVGCESAGWRSSSIRNLRPGSTLDLSRYRPKTHRLQIHQTKRCCYDQCP